MSEGFKLVELIYVRDSLTQSSQHLHRSGVQPQGWGLSAAPLPVNSWTFPALGLCSSNSLPPPKPDQSVFSSPLASSPDRQPPTQTHQPTVPSTPPLPWVTYIRFTTWIPAPVNICTHHPQSMISLLKASRMIINQVWQILLYAHNALTEFNLPFALYGSD